MTITLDRPATEVQPTPKLGPKTKPKKAGSTATLLNTLLHPQSPGAENGIVWKRVFSPTADPYETIEMIKRDIEIRNYKTGEIVLKRDGVLFPVFWSPNASQIFTEHYLDKKGREQDVRQSIDRVVDTITKWSMLGRRERRELRLPKLFADEESAANFAADLKYAMITQEVNFNSPVWYNIGVPGVPQQCSACFILKVEDDMKSITNWYDEEATVFKGGSGAGLDISAIRSSYEGLSHGGKASGPLSYARAADASAGTMASGGRSRRAAKMLSIGVDHPDIYEQATMRPLPGGGSEPVEGFIRVKERAEQIARTLRDAGYDMDVASGTDAVHVQYQNANVSVRVGNDFMETMLAGGRWQTRARRPELVWKDVPEYDATFLWREIARAAHSCADPGLQFDTTINHWHTTPAAGRINSSNPCSEYMSLDNSPCNLAPTNLLKFLREDGSWDISRFIAATTMLAIAQTVLAAYSDYPTDRISEVARGFRQIGHGYTNLGALLMASSYPYDSDEGRSWTAAITSLMQATLYRTSSQIAEVWGAYEGVKSKDPERELPGFDHPANRTAHLRVAEQHHAYHRAIAKAPTARGKSLAIKLGTESHIVIFHKEIVGSGAPVKKDKHLREVWQAGDLLWTEARAGGEVFGYANSHLSVLAPNGTNGLASDCDTLGIEPDMGLRKNKKKVNGDQMVIVNKTIERAVLMLGYTLAQAQEIVEYAEREGSVVGAPHLDAKHYPIFDTSMEEKIGRRSIATDGHQKMMGAAQPFLSGAISKTVNCPNQTTVEEVEKIHFDSWRLGLKSTAIYRDGSKQTQPVNIDANGVLAGPPPTVRHSLPRTVPSERIQLKIGGMSFFMHLGSYADGKLGEVFFTGQQGSTVDGLLDGAAKQVSMSLQHGTPVYDIVKMWYTMKFAPEGMLSPADSAFTSCTSILNLAAKEIALHFLDGETRRGMGILTRAELTAQVNGQSPEDKSGESGTEAAKMAPKQLNAAGGTIKSCTVCGGETKPVGTCDICTTCGASTGCS